MFGIWYSQRQTYTVYEAEFFNTSLSGRKVAVYAGELGTIYLVTRTLLETQKFTCVPYFVYITTTVNIYKLYIELLRKTIKLFMDKHNGLIEWIPTFIQYRGPQNIII